MRKVMKKRRTEDECDPRDPSKILPPMGTEKPDDALSGTGTPTISSESLSRYEDLRCGEAGPSPAAIKDLQSKLLLKIADPVPASLHKITIVGAGSVGMACAFSLLSQGVTGDLCLIDIDTRKALGEQMDLQHASSFLHSAKIQSGSDYNLSAGSKIIIISAGVRQKDGETRLALLERNHKIFEPMIPVLAAKSPNAIFVVVSNPVDVLTHLTWKLSGFPQCRVLGTGTNLDTSRFRFMIAQKLGVAPESVHGWIIGEHGDSSVAVWSGLNIAGVHLRDIKPDLATDNDPDNWKCVHGEVISGAYKVIALKGYTSWAIGASVADMCITMLRNTARVHCVSVCCTGIHGIQDEAFLSLPCSLGGTGVISAVIQKLNDDELQKLRNSAKLMADAIKQLNL